MQVLLEHAGNVPPPFANLLMCLLFEPDFKEQLTPLFVSSYDLLVNGVLDEDASVSKDAQTRMVDVSVQLFSNAAVTVYAATEFQLLSTLMKSLMNATPITKIRPTPRPLQLCYR